MSFFKNYTKWEHVMFVEDFRSGIKVYEILRRENVKTGSIQYKSVYVKSCVHGLVNKMNEWFKKKS